MAWAMRLPLKPASTKFVLVALCDNVGTDSVVWPSIAELVEKTSLDRKTVIAALDQLESLGLLSDTGERRGRTGQVKVYSVGMETVPKSEQFQERNSTDIPSKESRFSAQTVPVFRGKSPENGTRNLQGTIKEPAKEPKERAREALSCPDEVPQQVWDDWQRVRAAKRSGAVTATALAGIKREAALAGLSLADALVVCCERSWVGFRADWYANLAPQARASPPRGNDRSAKAAASNAEALRLLRGEPADDPNTIDMEAA